MNEFFEVLERWVKTCDKSKKCCKICAIRTGCPYNDPRIVQRLNDGKEVLKSMIDDQYLTRKQYFFKVFPDARTDENGYPKTCCANIGFEGDCFYECKGDMNNCETCWDKPMEEDNE